MNRPGTTDGPKKKAKKAVSAAVHVYRPSEADDDVSYSRNLDLLSDELAKPKPRQDALKQLMTITFANRTDNFINNGKPATLSAYLREFPLLKKATYVSSIRLMTLRNHRVLSLRHSLTLGSCATTQMYATHLKSHFPDGPN